MRSVPSGTSGVRTVASVQVVGCMSSVLRSVQYCQPAVLSCRNSVMDASGVVVLYHRPRSYCLPGVTTGAQSADSRSEEHTSELQSRENLVCRLLLEKKNKNRTRGR